MIVESIPRQLFELTCNQGSKLQPAESYRTKIRFFLSSGCYCHQMVLRMFGYFFVYRFLSYKKYRLWEKQSAFENMNKWYEDSLVGVKRCSLVKETRMFRVYCNLLICHLLFANKLFLESVYKVQTTQPTSKSAGDNVRITNNVSFAPRWVGAINQATFNLFILAKHV